MCKSRQKREDGEEVVGEGFGGSWGGRVWIELMRRMISALSRGKVQAVRHQNY